MSAVDLTDKVLDALDDASELVIEGKAWTFLGSGATVQWIASRTGYSDSSVRNAVKSLQDRRLVYIFDALDEAAHCRRFFVAGWSAD